MYCSKCGTQSGEGEAFCGVCGNKLQDVMPPTLTSTQTNQGINEFGYQTQGNSSVQNYDPNLTTSVSNMPNFNDKQNINNSIPSAQMNGNLHIRQGNDKKISTNATIGLIVGIISLVLSLVISIFVIPLAIVGLVFSILGRKDVKGIVGIILSSLSILVAVVFIVIAIFITFTQITSYQGEYSCTEYSSVDAYNDNDDIAFILNSDYTFEMYYKANKNKLYINGKYEAEFKEYNENLKTNSYTLTLIADERIINGVKSTNPYTTKYEIQLDNKKSAFLINTGSYNMYACTKK